jgi:hypothetical protein
MTIYVNDNCPNECNTHHRVSHDRGTDFICKETDEVFVWCELCATWTSTGDYPQAGPVIISGGTVQSIRMCDPEAHGYARCTQCNNWTNANNQYRACYSDDPYCGTCFDSTGGCDCSDCQPDFDYYPEPERDYDDYCAAGEDTYTCFTCNTENVYLDLVTEMFLCRCGMEAMLAKAPDHPFKMTAGAR